jgi:Luciferase-like monooxygenase
MNKISFGILELGYRTGVNSLSIANDILQYGIKAEELNFSRFWLAEHHNPNPLQPYNNPEILMTLLAGFTENIRIGSAGSLVGYHSPYTLACNYKLLNNLFNSRIDFGFSKGRPSNSNKHDFFRLRDDPHIKLFFDNLSAISELYHNEQAKLIENEIVIPPFGGDLPQLWYLSNSYNDSQVAISNKMNYCRSLIHGIGTAHESHHRDQLEGFKDCYLKSHGVLPETAVAIAISFKKNRAQIDLEQLSIENKREAFNIIPVKEESLFDLIQEHSEFYGVNEFIVCDTEVNPEIKNENLEIIRKIFS